MHESQDPTVSVIRFREGEVELFSRASHDVNPLHMSASYSRRTAFGQPVVFGVLGSLAAAGCARDRPGEVLSDVSATFHAPLFLGVDYRAEVQNKDDQQSKIVLRDSGKIVASVTLRFRAGVSADVPGAGTCPRREPLAYRVEDLGAGLEAVGVYVPEAGPFAELLRRWRLPEKGIAPYQAAALLWSSYLIGMELPGERAMFSRLRLAFSPETTDRPAGEPLEYTAQVTDLDPRFNFLQVEGQLKRGGVPWAVANLSALVRDDPPALSRSSLARLLTPTDALKGKTALVTGGARGLGAALVAALVSQGCHVLLNYRHGQADAESLRDALSDESGRITLVPGDASDPDWCARVRVDPVGSGGGLDLLILNASPPIRPLGLTPDALGRMTSFVGDTFRLVAAPLAALLEPVKARRGTIVVISSEYARTAPADFPHYVAAKRAAEGFAQSACAQFPGSRLLIVRPPRLLTDQTNTPSGREGALPAEQVAAAVVARLRGPTTELSMEVLEDF